VVSRIAMPVSSASSQSEVRHLKDLDQATRRLGNVHAITTTVLLLPPICRASLSPHAMPTGGGVVWGSGGWADEHEEMRSIPAGLHSSQCGTPHGRMQVWLWIRVSLERDN
jgi:hypothetical protein